MDFHDFSRRATRKKLDSLELRRATRKYFLAYPSSWGCRVFGRHGVCEISRRATLNFLFLLRGTREMFFASRDAKTFFRVPLSKKKK